MSVEHAEEEFGKNRAVVIGLSFLLAGAILAFDISLPLGVAAGVPYVALVLLGYRWRSDWAPIVLAVVATGLTIAGYFASSPSGMVWMVIINRVLAIFAICITALMVYGRKRDFEALCEARDTVDKQVKDRTAELLRANQTLKTEIFERKAVGDKLRD